MTSIVTSTKTFLIAAAVASAALIFGAGSASAIEGGAPGKASHPSFAQGKADHSGVVLTAQRNDNRRNDRDRDERWEDNDRRGGDRRPGHKPGPGKVGKPGKPGKPGPGKVGKPGPGKTGKPGHALRGPDPNTNPKAGWSSGKRPAPRDPSKRNPDAGKPRERRGQGDDKYDDDMDGGRGRR